MNAWGGLVKRRVLLDLACHMKAGHSAAAGVHDETLRTLFLDLKQAIFGLVDELAQRAVVDSADGSFNGDQLLKQDSVVHEAAPLR